MPWSCTPTITIYVCSQRFQVKQDRQCTSQNSYMRWHDENKLIIIYQLLVVSILDDATIWLSDRQSPSFLLDVTYLAIYELFDMETFTI